jgi:hypothetical protein
MNALSSILFPSSLFIAIFEFKNMKSTTLLNISLLLFFLNSSSMAQEEENYSKKIFIGIHATPTYSNRVWLSSPNYKPAMGFVSGVSGQCNFSKRWALHTELNYERSGYTVFDRNVYIDFTLPYVPPNRVTQTAYKINNFQLPISMKYNFINKEKITAFVNAGTIVNYIQSYKGVSTYTDGFTQHIHGKSNFANSGNHYFGLIAGLGTDITLGQRMHLTLEARVINTVHISYGLFTGLTYQLSK